MSQGQNNHPYDMYTEAMEREEREGGTKSKQREQEKGKGTVRHKKQKYRGIKRESQITDRT